MEKPCRSCLDSLVAVAAAPSVFFSLQTMPHRTRLPPSSCSSSSAAAAAAAAASTMEHTGIDSDGNTFRSRSQLWSVEAGENTGTGACTDPQKKLQWYTKGVSYWKGVDASVNGVLGGYGHVNEPDVAASDEFLMDVFRTLAHPSLSDRSKKLVALDCGAGVGRVTKHLLLRRFQEVDLVEPVSHFLDAAKEDLSSNSRSEGKAVNFYCAPLQEFTPQPNRYDVIWVQWCIGHLTDQDFVDFFVRAKAGLKQNGFLIVKENIAKQGFVVDKVDSSVTRSDLYFRELFEQTGLHLYKTKLQKGFPKELFAVRMYALTTQPLLLPGPDHQTKPKALNLPRKIF